MDSLCGRAGTTGRSEEDHFHLQVVTDPNGKFAFDKIPKMAVRLSASRDDYLEVYWFRRTADDPVGNYVIGPETSRSEERRVGKEGGSRWLRAQISKCDDTC